MPKNFYEFVKKKLDDPEFRKHYEAAVKRNERSISRPCPCGRDGCEELYDPVEDEVIGGWGPVGCPIN